MIYIKQCTRTPTLYKLRNLFSSSLHDVAYLRHINVNVRHINVSYQCKWHKFTHAQNILTKQDLLSANVYTSYVCNEFSML